MMNYPIKHTDDGQCGTFFIQIENKRLAELSYEYTSPQTIDANHTFVDPSLRNQGIAQKLLQALLDFTTQRQLKLTASCSYIAAKLRDK
ncbi:GNAT family N-acetyltransferase [Gallibacterium trehalosifermentans]|uniref:GNAT family N-acetyltransferase n=1 Tax=Gallibacterium trehalosifermentans TaxID=516935 RepID=A0ABV6H170_9PAST